MSKTVPGLISLIFRDVISDIKYFFWRSSDVWVAIGFTMLFIIGIPVMILCPGAFWINVIGHGFDASLGLMGSSWAEYWTVIIAFIGTGLWVMGIITLISIYIVRKIISAKERKEELESYDEW